MIVVVPVCHKDAHLARLNLEWVKQLEGSVPYKAILSHDRSFDPGDLLAGFKEYFSGGVEEFIYDPWKGSQNWPIPQNYAWQKAARYLQKYNDCWFWWEQDGVPLKKGWLQSIESEHSLGEKPFLLTCYDHSTCGLIVYPPKISKYCVSAFLAFDRPWDSIIADLSKNRISITKLIQSRKEYRDLTFSCVDDLNIFNSEAVVIHSCKNGSLQQLLLDIKSGKAPKSSKPKSIGNIIQKSKDPKLIDLSNVSLYACCWSDDDNLLERTAKVLRYCQKLFNFGETIYFCHRKPAARLDARFVQIPVLTGNNQWNVFINTIVPEFIKCDYGMSVHEDGFPVYPELWEPTFLEYDYIGAPWDDSVVGNGGFCIESKKILRLKSQLPFTTIPPGPSDYWVCRHNRSFLEKHGIRFAPVDIALRFSTETLGNDKKSFGFHGRKHAKAKYEEGWKKIKRSEKGIISVELVYIFVLSESHYLDQAKRFADSYMEFPPNYPHKTTIVCNCGVPTQSEKDIFKSMPDVSFFQYDNSGYDIGSYIAISKKSNSDLMVCLGSNVHFWKSGWLARMVEARLKHGPGVYGSNTSFQEMPHLNTTSIWCDPNLLASYPWPVKTKEDRYAFEQDKYRLDRPFWMYVHSLGKKALFVTWDGEYEWQDWRKPPNIFRRGDQSNMLVCWKWSDHWRDCNHGDKEWVSFVTDTLTLDPFNPDNFMDQAFFNTKTPREKDWIIKAFKEWTDGRSAMKKS